MRFSKISIVVFSVAFLFSCSKVELDRKDLLLDIDAAANGPNQGANGEYVPNEMLVKFKKGTSEIARARVVGLLNASVKEHIHTAAMKRFGDDLGVLLLKINENALDGISKAKAFGEIEYAEPNWVYYHNATSNDPGFTNGSLWGMYGASTSPANQFGSGAATAWSNGNVGKATVYIGIIDEGYMYNHQDLKDNAGVNPKEIAGNKKDDDGNGYVDDVYGWDFAGNNNTVFDGTSDDHGTHVAGTIGAKGGNGIGVAGVCWDIKLLSAKFLGTRGGTTANAVKAVDYFTDLKRRHGLNLVATNNSWGGGNYSQALFDAIVRAKVENILFIAATGNSFTNIDVTASFPASYESDNIIRVASIDKSGSLSYFSNYGPLVVDIAAPGSDIYSTLPGFKNSSIYGLLSGTSMATPHVTGAAALFASTFSAPQSYLTIKDGILKAATTGTGLPVINGRRLNVSGF
jgi:subtilisin family serine protease